MWCRRCLKPSKNSTCLSCYEKGWRKAEIRSLFRTTEVMETLEAKAGQHEHVLESLSRLIFVRVEEQKIGEYQYLIPYPSSKQNIWKINKRVCRQVACLSKCETLSFERALLKHFVTFPTVVLFSCVKESTLKIHTYAEQLKRVGVEKVVVVFLRIYTDST